MAIPTREELYAEVEKTFRESYPDAPLKLSRSGSHDADYRVMWLSIRDGLLNNEVNRIYWERFPDGPLQIDPENPDHNQYVNGWLEIRDAIMSNSPLPPDDGDEQYDIDMSWVRHDFNHRLVYMFPDVDPEYQQALRQYFDDAFEAVREAALVGSIPHRLNPPPWWAEPITVLRLDGTVSDELRASAFWDEDLLRGAAYLGVDWSPNSDPY